MSHSLRCRLGNLRHKGIISDKDYDRLCKALDNEKVLDKIRNELKCEAIKYSGTGDNVLQAHTDGLLKALLIIDKYREVDE